ncbi:MAG: carbon-nitrogen hydrolase [Hydrogenophaga sp.]|nr:carbon-nitrogen hydrolase [Hydrogenophaga sp.]
MDALRLALWQTPHPADSQEALARLDTAARDAAAQGAHWLITPEMFLTGYLIDPALIAARAEPVDGPLIAAVRAIAQRHALGIVTGWPEARTGALPFNSAIAIDDTGGVRAVHRKIHLFGDGDAQRFSPGTDAPALFAWRGWRLGLLICFDVEQDEPLQSLQARGAHAALVPTANMVGYDDVQQTRLPEAARRFGMAIAYANACGHEGGTVYNGQSTALGRDGARLSLETAKATALNTIELPPQRPAQ